MNYLLYHSVLVGPKRPRIKSIKNYSIKGLKPIVKRRQLSTTTLGDDCQILVLQKMRNSDSLTSEFHSGLKNQEVKLRNPQ